LFLGRSPTLPLRLGDPLPGGRAHLPPFARRLRRGGGIRATAGHQLPEFCNLRVKALLLRLKPFIEIPSRWVGARKSRRGWSLFGITA
jgi:hypothetical protein